MSSKRDFFLSLSALAFSIPRAGALFDDAFVLLAVSAGVQPPHDGPTLPLPQRLQIG